MKILKIDNYVSERIKVQPITNIELDKCQEELKKLPSSITVSSIKNIDELKPGWLVVTKSLRPEISDEYTVRVVVPSEYSKNLFSDIPSQMLFVCVSVDKFYPDGYLTYFKSDVFDKSFPYSYNKWFVVDKIYKYDIPDLKDICSCKRSFMNWYNKQKFDILK